mmetsp:Transcript_76495/g.241897  ORF Transcript_76495/g.241897 Transcript_76495/m.241897 type:complete len:243 (+) Transcript_76495:715-1443(+)
MRRRPAQSQWRLPRRRRASLTPPRLKQPLLPRTTLFHPRRPSQIPCRRRSRTAAASCRRTLAPPGRNPSGRPPRHRLRCLARQGSRSRRPGPTSWSGRPPGCGRLASRKKPVPSSRFSSRPMTWASPTPPSPGSMPWPWSAWGMPTWRQHSHPGQAPPRHRAAAGASRTRQSRGCSAATGRHRSSGGSLASARAGQSTPRRRAARAGWRGSAALSSVRAPAGSGPQSSCGCLAHRSLWWSNA